jgi:predicted DNA-binding ribbon-helix-helix protein
MTDFYHPPVKRSVEIAGHKTSISLEPVFWDLLRLAADAENIPINALVARIDVERLTAASPPGLAGAIRQWLAAGLAVRQNAGPGGTSPTTFAG